MDLTKAIDLLKQVEGCSLTSYPDANGRWAICYGANLPGLKAGMACTQFDCDDMLEKKVQEVAQNVISTLGFTPSDNELCACVSLAYNIGEEAFRISTLAHLMRNGAPKAKIAQEFLKWDKSQGRTLAGLDNRRQLEMALFLS